MPCLSQSLDWGMKHLNIPKAWTRSRGKDITIIIIDTGCPAYIDRFGKYKIHPDLKNTILEEECRSFVPCEDIYDRNGHSSMCSGIIGAEDNNIGFVGYAPECRIITYKAISETGAGQFEWIENALKAAIDRNPDIVSMSIGATEGSARMHMYISMLDELHIPVIAAAGNGGEDEGVNYPAKYEEPIAIGAYDKHYKVANFSAIGPEIDFVLPGVDITSTYINGAYATMSGTSFACPSATGVVALLLSKYKSDNIKSGNNTRMTTWEIYDKLKEHSVNKKNPGVKDPRWGWGMLDVENLILNIGNFDPESPPSITNTPKLPKKGWWSRIKNIFRRKKNKEDIW